MGVKCAVSYCVVTKHICVQVTVVGDGTSDPIHLSGDKLNDKAQVEEVVSQIKMPAAVKQTRKPLGDKVFE